MSLYVCLITHLTEIVSSLIKTTRPELGNPKGETFKTCSAEATRTGLGSNCRHFLVKLQFFVKGRYFWDSAIWALKRWRSRNIEEIFILNIDVAGTPQVLTENKKYKKPSHFTIIQGKESMIFVRRILSAPLYVQQIAQQWCLLYIFGVTHFRFHIHSRPHLLHLTAEITWISFLLHKLFPPTEAVTV